MPDLCTPRGQHSCVAARIDPPTSWPSRHTATSREAPAPDATRTQKVAKAASAHPREGKERTDRCPNLCARSRRLDGGRAFGAWARTGQPVYLARASQTAALAMLLPCRHGAGSRLMEPSSWCGQSERFWRKGRHNVVIQPRRIAHGALFRARRSGVATLSSPARWAPPPL